MFFTRHGRRSSRPPLDLICFSHLRWDLVFRRPQHLMSRFAREGRVLFIEEPLRDDVMTAELRSQRVLEGVTVATPILPRELRSEDEFTAQSRVLAPVLQEVRRPYVLWYYTPMALPLGAYLAPAVTVYDCMNELRLVERTHPALATREAQLFQRADLVFTDDHGLQAAKRHRHPRMHCFPSNVDSPHSKISWERTFNQMKALIDRRLNERSTPRARPAAA